MAHQNRHEPSCPVQCTECITVHSRSTQGKGSSTGSLIPTLAGEQAMRRLTAKWLDPKPWKVELSDEPETGGGKGGGGECVGKWKVHVNIQFDFN